MKKSNLKFLIPVALLFFLDRMTKEYFLSHFGQGESVPVWGKWLCFTLVFNKGAAFGSWQNKNLFLTILSGVILIALLFLLFRSTFHDILSLAGILLIISGAFGNLYD
ncbi:MAG: signal peptidase II, partial [Candidatus Aureabacteria bacterium]|nr:signal peptidase II [Candidatus Auribacterota bacterium]